MGVATPPPTHKAHISPTQESPISRFTIVRGSKMYDSTHILEPLTNQFLPPYPFTSKYYIRSSWYNFWFPWDTTKRGHTLALSGLSNISDKNGMFSVCQACSTDIYIVYFNKMNEGLELDSYFLLMHTVGY